MGGPWHSTELSAVQKRILKGMSLGETNPQIARTIGISEKTLDYHARQVFRKLAARNRAHAVLIGCRMGIIK